MSASLVLGVAGGVIGGMAGMPTWGAQAGFMLGAAIGGAIDAAGQPAKQGPRLGDLRIQTSTYGKAIPQIFGTARIAGNTIWSTQLLETAHSSGGGGKGGGGGGQGSYTYAASFAVALCSTTRPDGTCVPIAGVGRIWADGQLIANFGSVDPGTIMASYANGGGKDGSGVGYQASGSSQLYTGTETQLPNPTMQAYLGAANVPSYRGTAYIVFSNLQLQKFGNRVPNIECEVIAGSMSVTTSIEAKPAVSGAPGASMSEIDGNYLYSVGTAYLSGGLAITNISNPSSPIPVSFTLMPSGNSADSICIQNGLAYITTGGNLLYIFNITVPSLPVLISSTAIAASATTFIAGNYYYAINYSLLSIYDVTNPLTVVMLGSLAGVGGGSGLIQIQVIGSIAYIMTYDQRIIIIDVSNKITPILRNSQQIISIVGASKGHSFDVVGSYLYVFDAGISSLLIYAISSTYTLTLSGSIVFPTWPSGGYQSNPIRVVGNWCWVTSTMASVIAIVDVTSKTNPILVKQTSLNPTDISVKQYQFEQFCFSIAGNSSGSITACRYATAITTATTTADVIITRICQQVGAGSVDVSQITDVVDGYVISNQMTARAAIEPLQRAFYFDAVESDNLIRFAKRGAQPITIIPEDDLAAHSPQTKQVPPAITLARTQDLELPRVCNVSYYNTSNAFQMGAQYAQRQTTPSRQTLDLQVPICMSDAHAKQMAEVNLYVAWIARNTVRFSTTRKYAYLDPSDVVRVVRANGIVYTLLLTKKTEKAGGIIDWEAIADEASSATSSAQGASVYTQVAIASPSPVPITTISPLQNTRIEFLDIPLLRDQDDATASGFYSAASGVTDGTQSGWGGGVLQKSIDSGATYSTLAGLTVPGAIMGNAITVLGNFLGGNVFDELNQVTIITDYGQLSGVTMLQVLNGSNVAVIGNEIIQYRDATLTAANTYVLGGLLRGRFGTEQYMATHAAGDRFIVLDTATIQRELAAINEIGQPRLYKAITNYQLASAATSVSFTDTGAGLKPLSPAQIGGGRDTAGNLTINWARRTRIGGGWNNFSDVPLGETSESYSIDVMAGTLVKRTLTSATPTVSYTAAQQVTDFGSNQSSVLINCYQISGTIGRGFAGIATV